MTEACGCCEGVSALTPVTIDNRPGLSAIAYRIGTYGAFRQSMLAALASTPELSGLSTRESDDYAITLLDLWAAVADILTFYQERYANEAYLRTATRDESVAGLAALIDYQPSPGTAAVVWLAFTLEQDKTVQIPEALKVQSVPGQDETPQTFETIEAITADAIWNALRVYPEPVDGHPLRAGSSEATLDRTAGPTMAASLAPGDRLVIFEDGSHVPVEEKEIASITATDDRAVVTWSRPIHGADWNGSSQVYKFKRTFRLFGYRTPSDYTKASTDSSGRVGWSLESIAGFSYPGGDPEGDNLLCLDAVYDGIVPGMQLLVANPEGEKTLVTVTAVDEAQDTLGGTVETVTRVTVSTDTSDWGDRRKVRLYELVGSAITFWNQEYSTTLTGDTVYLPGWTEDGETIEVGRTIKANAFVEGVELTLSEVEVGRTVMLSDGKSDPVVATIAATPTLSDPDANGFCHLMLTLEVDESLALDPTSAQLLGNVAKASHGETVSEEILGSGDASATLQTFTLKKNPLTYVPDATPEGASNTLKVLVNGVRWKEANSLYGQGSTSQVHHLRQNAEGTTTVEFGDGVTGAVLPTGQNNVVATYRVGAGLDGRVAPSSLTTLLTRPTGLSSATNPLAAEGGADPETADSARESAPQTVRTFGRAVSIQDFEDLVKASGEVAKSQADWVWDGLERTVHLTVAAQEGDTLSSDGLSQLASALSTARDPNHRLKISNFTKAPILLDVSIQVDPDYVREGVEEAARSAIEDALAFDSLNLGESVHLSDVYRVLQDVDGVLYVDVNQLGFKQPSTMSVIEFQADLDARGAERLPDGSVNPVQAHLRIHRARPDSSNPGTVRPAELATVESSTQDITITVSGGL